VSGFLEVGFSNISVSMALCFSVPEDHIPDYPKE
jgi:hypothetical protein